MPHCLPHLSGFISAYHPLLVSPPPTPPPPPPPPLVLPSPHTPSIVPRSASPPVGWQMTRGLPPHQQLVALFTYAAHICAQLPTRPECIHPRRRRASAGTGRRNYKHIDMHQMAKLAFRDKRVHNLCWKMLRD